MSKVLEGLNKEQKEAAAHGEGPLLIVAGAGTGKTTVITRRIAYLIEQGVKPEEILAMAFGDKAAQEMEERVDQLLPLGYYNLQISTFHAFGERLLKEYGLAIGLPDFKVLDEVGQWLLIRNNLDKFDLDYYRPLGNPTRFIRELTRHFARCKDELISPEQYLRYAEKVRLNQDSAESGSDLSAPSTGHLPSPGEKGEVQEVANAYHVYQRLLLQNNALDFGDLINYSLKLLKDRPRILEKMRQQYKYILIDEFQDTNLAQYELVKLLAAPRNNLTVVGDDDQSIYKFRGAAISNILHFQKDYPGAKFVSLVQNYRSTQKILDKAYEFITQNNPERLEVKLGIEKRLKGSNGSKGEIRVMEAEDYVKEAEMVAGEIEKGAKGGKGEKGWNDFAILARSHEALEPFVAELESRGIPYIYFANRGLYRKPIILDIIAYFRLLDNYHENSAMYRVLRMPVWGISERELIELTHYARRKAVSLFEALAERGVKGAKGVMGTLEKHTRAAREESVGQLFVEVVQDLEIGKQAGADDLKGLQNAKYLEAFHKKIQNFQNESEDRHLKAFMEALRFELEAGEQGKLEFDPESGPEAVRLMTVHGAKGLEFTTVFVVGLVDKRFPSIERREQIEIPAELIREVLPEGDVHLQEERRLFYVAMTRARRNLFFTRAYDYGGKTTKKPSRFLVESGLARDEKAKPVGKVQWEKSGEMGGKGIMGGRGGIALPVPKYFSFSQISTFKKCPLEYKYRYILKLPEPGSAQLSFGLTIHRTFEKFLRGVMQSRSQKDLFSGLSAPSGHLPSPGEKGLPDSSALEKFYRESWVDDWFEDKTQKEKFRALGLKMLKDFYEEAQQRPPRPKYLEASFRLPLKNGMFLGKIDRADEGAQGLVIIDYKTGAARQIEKVDREQLLIYQWAAAEFFREKVADLQYWFLKDKLKKESFLGKPADLAALQSGIEETVGEIIECVKQNNFDEADRRVSHDCAYRELET